MKTEWLNQQAKHPAWPSYIAWIMDVWGNEKGIEARSWFGYQQGWDDAMAVQSAKSPELILRPGEHTWVGGKNQIGDAE